MQKTAYEMRISDWSSDVCSSDLLGQPRLPGVAEPAEVTGSGDAIFVVGVDMERRPGAVGDAHHAAALVGHQEPARAAADRAALVPDDRIVDAGAVDIAPLRSEEHTSDLQSLMRVSYAVFCLNTKTTTTT